MHTVWASSENKSRLLQLTRKVVTARNFPVNIILSGMVVDEELLPAMYISHQAGLDETMEIE